MYRIFCESYQNFEKSFIEDSYRLEVAKPLKLLTDIDEYNKEKNEESEIYKKLCDLIYFMKNNIKEYPRLEAFLWTLSARKIEEKTYKIAQKEELEEQTKLVNSFLKLAYWYE